jgi:hypothetical protein
MGGAPAAPGGFAGATPGFGAVGGAVGTPGFGAQANRGFPTPGAPGANSAFNSFGA